MRLCAVHNPYAMILDLHLEDIDGFEVIASLHPSRHKPRFLVTSSHSEEYTLERLERAHVDAFVGKEDGPGEFLEALEALRRGRRYFSASHRARRDARARNPKLASRIMSERESEVLHLVGCGMSDDEIADSLGVARCTAHNHRARIMHKLGITSSPKLVVFAIERGYALWKRTIETVGD
jgi:two-component system response regulator NreC